jgi:hypothetical protein
MEAISDQLASDPGRIRHHMEISKNYISPIGPGRSAKLVINIAKFNHSFGSGIG